MPENPECTYIAFQLNQMIQKFQLTSIEVLGGKFEKKGITDLEKFKQLLPLRILEVKCKGKMIYMELSKMCGIISTLGMTGGWKKVQSKHSHLKLTFSTELVLYYDDMRRFGNFYVYTSADLMYKKLNTIGLDFLNQGVITKELFILKGLSAMKKYPNKHLAIVLMDQKTICSGIGNYILSEVLYTARVNPFALMKHMNRQYFDKLYDACFQVINDSYRHKGNSLQDYKDLDNEDGEYQNFMKVYQMKTDPLGYQVISTTGPHKRSIHYVPELQLQPLIPKWLMDYFDRLSKDMGNKVKWYHLAIEFNQCL